MPDSFPDRWKEAYARLYHAGRADFPPACLHYVETVVRQAAIPPTVDSPVRSDARDDGSHEGGTPPDDDPDSRDSTERGTEHATGTARSLPPAAVIAAFRNAVRQDFGALRAQVLREWGLLTPFDLGRAIGLLGHVDRLILDDGDAPAFYAHDPVPLAEDARPPLSPRSRGTSP